MPGSHTPRRRVELARKRQASVYSAVLKFPPAPTLGCSLFVLDLCRNRHSIARLRVYAGFESLLRPSPWEACQTEQIPVRTLRTHLWVLFIFSLCVSLSRSIVFSLASPLSWGLSKYIKYKKFWKPFQKGLYFLFFCCIMHLETFPNRKNC